MPSEPNLRRLGLGSSGGGPEQPFRAQVVVALVGVALLIAIPLYILRSPNNEEPTSAPLATTNRTAAGGIVRHKLDAGAPKSDVKLGPTERLKCSASRRNEGNEGGLCDPLQPLEEDLRKSILASAECAPRTGKEGTINFVLEVDFTEKTVNVFPGASGGWKGKQARRATQCVVRALPEVKWEEVKHQYRFYKIAVLATYPAPNPLDGLPEFQ